MGNTTGNCAGEESQTTGKPLSRRLAAAVASHRSPSAKAPSVDAAQVDVGKAR